MRSRPILAADPGRRRPMPVTVRRTISPGWNSATSMPMWRPAGPESEKIAPPTRLEAMRAKIKAGGHASPYRLRKQLPEPVFGQIKQARGFRQFLLRGFEKVRAEWAIVCTAHNLLKLAQRRSLSAALSTAR